MKWPRKFRTYWCVVDGDGVAMLSTASVMRKNSIAGWLREADIAKRGWRWWRGLGYSCRQIDVKVRSSS